MYTFITVLHIIVAFLLVIVILLQIGKAGGLGGIFGGGGTEQLFSTPSGTSFLRKTTIVLAIVFMLTSLSLTFIGYRKASKTVTGKVPSVPVESSQPSAESQPESAPAPKTP